VPLLRGSSIVPRGIRWPSSKVAYTCYPIRLGLRLLPAIVAGLVLSGCGYIGDPLPPLANIPSRVTDLAAVQRGSRIIAHFTIPERTTEGFPIPRPLTFDLRAGLPTDPFEENEWASRARHIPAADITGPVATYEFSSAEWTGKDIVLGVRVIGGTGKQTSWSNWVVIHVVPSPSTPEVQTPVATANGVRLTWRAAGSNFRILRKVEGGEYVVAGESTTPEWTDTAAEFGKRYAYIVQTVVKLGDNMEAESDLSAEATITPVDTFPPAVPKALRADAAPASIELAWERNTEPDLGGYRVYRAVGGGPMERLGEAPGAPTYSDRSVEHGKTYRYAVTSVDRAGNESAPSAAVEVVW
jgi:hypothetical protein